MNISCTGFDFLLFSREVVVGILVVAALVVNELTLVKGVIFSSEVLWLLSSSLVIVASPISASITASMSSRLCLFLFLEM